jgi:hypothetical protein
MVFISRNWFAMQGPVAIILISWNVIFIWETGYWTRAIKRLSKQYHIGWRKCQKYVYVTHWQKILDIFDFFIFSLYENASLCLYQVRVITVFTVFRLLTDFVCLYNYEFWLSLCKIVRSSVILLLPLLNRLWSMEIMMITSNMLNTVCIFFLSSRLKFY